MHQFSVHLVCITNSACCVWSRSVRWSKLNRCTIERVCCGLSNLDKVVSRKRPPELINVGSADTVPSGVWQEKVLGISFSFCMVNWIKDTLFWNDNQILLSVVKHSCNELNNRTLNAISSSFPLFTCGGPRHLSRSKQFSGGLIFLWEQLVMIFMSSYYYLMNILNIKILSLNFLPKTTCSPFRYVTVIK